MAGVTATGATTRNFRGQGVTFYDFSSSGGLTLANSTLTAAIGQATSATTSGRRMQWTSATSGQQTGFSFTPSSALDFTNVESFGFEFDFSADPTLASLGGIRVIFANAAAYTKYWTKLANTGTPHYGRRIMWLNKSDFGVGAGAPTWDNIVRAEIYWQRSTRNTSVVKLDVTCVGMYTKFRHQTPTLIWTFDDGDTSQYTEAYLGTTNPTSSMSAYGWKGTCFINDSSIGDSTHMSLANLTTLYNAGWDICPHGTAHNAVAWQYSPSISVTTLTLANGSSVAHGYSPGDNVTVYNMDPIEMNGTFPVATTADTVTMTCTIPTPEATTNLVGYNTIDFKNQTSIATNLSTNLAYLQNNGFTRALNFYAYPYGYHSPTAIALLQSYGITVARTLGTMTGSTQTFGWSGITNSPSSLDWMRLPARGLSNTDTGATVLADIDLTIKYGGAIIIYGHDFVTAPSTSRQFSIANLKILFDGVKARERLGLIQVRTLKEYADGCKMDAI